MIWSSFIRSEVYDRVSLGKRIKNSNMKPAALPLIGILLVTMASTATGEFSYRLAVRDDGVYRVSFDALGYTGELPETSRIFLSERGKSVELRVEDGGDGLFGPGDHFTFVGRHLDGPNAWFDEHSAENVYRLGLRDQDNSNPLDLPELTGRVDTPVVQHFEQQLLRVALPESDETDVERWYWKRLSHLDHQPFQLELADGLTPVGITAAFAGLSRDAAALAAGLPQHVVELWMNGSLVGQLDWNGQQSASIDVEHQAIDRAIHGNASHPVKLEVRVPIRRIGENDAPLIDLVLLNWIEIEYAAAPGQISIPERNSGRRLLVPKHYLSPLWIRPDRHSSLRADRSQVDYLMITHGSLRAALEPLAAMHRRQGLRVQVVDVEDIYDEYNHGIVSPQAILEFIRYTRKTRQAPAVRYVLLAGDASWDVYSDAGARRNLVPTMQVQAYDELAASDNGFATSSDDDWRPDLAIGRIPAATADELSIVVDKMVRYAEDSPEGEWRRNITWVTDINEDFQSISNQLAEGLTAAGFLANRIYPRENEETGAQNQQDIVDAINNGQLLLHFLGHGGRFVWRTGAPDYRNSSDLFSTRNIDQLQNRGRLPMVLSMTCSSGPFDHPEAGSIAEAFLVHADGGAVGVLAASWRVPASQSFSSLLMGELTQNGQSVGEAIMKAKQSEPNRALVESYNLLGDPALVLQLPQPGKSSP